MGRNLQNIGKIFKETEMEQKFQNFEIKSGFFKEIVCSSGKFRSEIFYIVQTNSHNGPTASEFGKIVKKSSIYIAQKMRLIKPCTMGQKIQNLTKKLKIHSLVQKNKT